MKWTDYSVIKESVIFISTKSAKKNV